MTDNGRPSWGKSHVPPDTFQTDQDEKQKNMEILQFELRQAGALWQKKRPPKGCIALDLLEAEGKDCVRTLSAQHLHHHQALIPAIISKRGANISNSSNNNKDNASERLVIVTF